MSDAVFMAIMMGVGLLFMVVYYISTELAVAQKEKSCDEIRGRICDRLEELAERSYQRRMRRQERERQG